MVCFFGEGALPSGHAHEALNLAALWKLPVIFVCENNRYAMGTPAQRGLALYSRLLETARAYGIEAVQVDGMDVLAVRTLAQSLVSQARGGGGPFFVEAITYRFMGHSMSDPAHGHYRTKDEVEVERKRDPLILLQGRIREEGLGTDADFRTIEQEVAHTITASVRFAEESPFPEPQTLHDNVMAEERHS